MYTLLTHKQSIYRNDWYSLFFVIVSTLLFYGSYQLLAGYTHPNFFFAMKTADKIVNILHIISTVLVAIFFLNELISHEQFSKLITISRGYLIYDTGLMLTFYYIQKLSYVRTGTLVLHHLIFLWLTYQIDRYPKLLAQGLRAEVAKIPHYTWWLVAHYAQDYIFLSTILMVTTLVAALVIKIFSFTRIGIITWCDPNVTRLEFFWLFILILGNYISVITKFYTRSPG